MFEPAFAERPKNDISTFFSLDFVKKVENCIKIVRKLVKNGNFKSHTILLFPK